MKIVKTIHVIGFSLLLPRLFLPHPFSINKQKNKSTRGISLRNIHTLASESAEKLGSWPKKSGKETCQSCASQNFYIYIYLYAHHVLLQYRLTNHQNHSENSKFIPTI